MNSIKVKTYKEIPKNYTGIVFHSSGAEYWFKEGKFHREDGPAVELPDGRKYWYKEGKIHREDGPAVEYANGEKEWWIENKSYTQNYLVQLITTFVFLEKEIGKHGLSWYKFFTDQGIEEFPFISEMETDKRFKELFKTLEQEIGAIIT